MSGRSTAPFIAIGHRRLSHRIRAVSSKSEKRKFKRPNRSFATVVDEQPAGRIQRAIPATALGVDSGLQRAACGLTIGIIEDVHVFHAHEVNRQPGCLKSSAKVVMGMRFADELHRRRACAMVAGPANLRMRDDGRDHIGVGLFANRS